MTEERASKIAHFVSQSCEGERCALCGKPATHKIGEEIPPDDLAQIRHNLTAYVCCPHFRMIFGPAAPCTPVWREAVLAGLQEVIDHLEGRHLLDPCCPECGGQLHKANAIIAGRRETYLGCSKCGYRTI